MFDRRLIDQFDWGMAIIILLLGAIGLLTLYSAVEMGEGSSQKYIFVKQGIWFCIGAMAMIGAISIDYKHMDRWAYVIYGVIVLLLICVLLFGKVSGGSRRWLALGPATLQPSELAKIAVVIVLARYYSRVIKIEGFALRELIYPCILTLVPFGLIVKQPDLGTGMIIVLIAASMTFFVKIRRNSLIYLILGGVLGAPILWQFLKGYQKQRILTFLDPDRDPLGTGYHIIQSKIAIGSGMIHGKGFLKGTQNTLSFLPEQHTDFIFSVLAEEWGFLGAFTTQFLFLLLIIWGLNIAYNCRNSFGIILSVGMTATIFWQTFINLGMIMGLVPVVGMPLPFISYGGSSILTVMICTGILMNVSIRRYMVD
jgi:rod shape determining protein RodA